MEPSSALPFQKVIIWLTFAVRVLIASIDRQFLLLGSEDGSFSIALDAEARWKILQSTLDKSPLLGLPSDYLLSP